MPLYDFRCRSCGEHFEQRTAAGPQALCPVCGASDCERLLTPFAGPFRVGLRGGAARRSDATRRAREDQRQEGFARQREERRQRGADD